MQQPSTPLLQPARLSYRDKFVQMDREAAATLSAALLIFICFWLAVWLFMDEPGFILGLPLWFVLSCLGGYLLSVVAVAVLVHFVMKDFPLDDTAPPS